MIRDASQDRQPEIHSTPVREDSSKNYGADEKRLQISDFSFRQISFTSNVCLLEDMIQDRGIYLFTISYGSYALDQRSGDMVDSVDDFKSSSSVRGIQMPNFEVLDARIASALNRIIHNSHFRRRISLEEMKSQKEDRFFRGRQIAYLIYEYFWVIGANDSVDN